ncbi:MAG: type II CRISPR-associated endonuclease Cas1 [Thermoplasmata archaeon]|nr:type II CRISPR-associated endonuclease Cas1 [Thermoplasmata archaeon]
MTWRIVEISSNSKLEYKLNYLVVRTPFEIRKVYIPEIAVLIIESTAVSLTATLLCELTKRKIRVIFCDEKRNPYSELCPYYGSHDTVRKLRIQYCWDEDLIEAAWTKIVHDKISKQRDVLFRRGLFQKSELLSEYLSQMEPYDLTNREGHAAKVYFNALFGKDFSRNSDCISNAALDYGYTILLSAFNREISICGYYTQIGIFHDNIFNPFNLASDLMESFRPIVDEYVVSSDFKKFDSEQKAKVVNLLNSYVHINGKQNHLINAIRIYVQSFFDAMEHGDLTRMVSYEVSVYEGDGFL